MFNMISPHYETCGEVFMSAVPDFDKKGEHSLEEKTPNRRILLLLSLVLAQIVFGSIWLCRGNIILKDMPIHGAEYVLHTHCCN